MQQSMEVEVNNDEWTTCPYDESHRVPRLRIQYHLVKCQKRHPKLEICPYNATHRFHSSEIKEHCKNCPDRQIDEENPKHYVKSGHITAPKPILQREYLPETDPNHECWDD